jgi:hypothetical protein
LESKKKEEMEMRAELERIENEKSYTFNKGKNDSFSISYNSILCQETKVLEDSLVRFKFLNAKNQEKYEILHDFILQLKDNIASKKTLIQKLNKDINQYYEYRKIIQQSISRNSSTQSSSISSNSTSVSSLNSSTLISCFSGIQN